MTPSKSHVDEPAGTRSHASTSTGRSLEAPESPTSDSTTSDRESEINKELRRLNRALRALSACNQALAQAGSEQGLLDQICDLIVRLGEYRLAWIGYAMPDAAKTVRVMAYAGDDAGTLNTAVVSWAADKPTGRGSVGTAIRDNKACLITDTQTDPRFEPWRDWARKMGYGALITFPLRVAGLPFGSLTIYAREAGSFEKPELQLLEEIAENLAYGITAIRTREESKRTEAALLEAEARYRLLVEEVPAISYLAEAGATGPFFYVSPQVKTILGYRPEECMADPTFWWEHLHPHDRGVAEVEDAWQDGVAFQFEYRMIHRDGRQVWIRDEGTIFRSAETGKRMARGQMIDITRQKEAEDALRESEERYRRFVNESSEGIYRMEYDPPVPTRLSIEEQLAWGYKTGSMAECNDAMARMYGFASADELAGKKLSEFLVLHDPVTRQFMENYIRNGYRIANQESREIDALGKKRIFRNTMVGTVVDGHWVRDWGITRDVTDQMQMEEQLRNAQQLEAIGRLAGGVAHDFNNILSIIIGHGELLLAMGNDERTRSGIQQIQRAAERAASLTQQLLAFGRKQVLQPTILDLNEAVADVQKMLARVIGEDIELIAKLHPSLGTVKADPGQIEQVLMNLAINARDAMPQGGRFTMETSNEEINPEQGRDLDLTPGHYVMLRVSDNGHGMDDTTLSHIFEPFFTTKPVGKGTGLGLATVYGIVKQSGGSIQVESEAGQGTEFRVFLPAADSELRKEPIAIGNQDVAGGTETILIAEDEKDLRALTRIFLESYGYRVLEASSAEEAIEKTAKSAEPIHLLLTDVIMPGISGRQLAERILSRHPQTKILYMTGYTDEMVAQHRVLDSGLQLLQKPFTKQELALKVRAALDGAEGGQASEVRE